ncbi:MAG TPA: hypothetical protein VF691_03060 [Cytophagaceae bacterium]|jgi:hypothetical protein
MKITSRTKIFGLILLLILSITFFIFYTKKDLASNKREVISLENLPRLLSIQNFHNFYYQDKSEDVYVISQHKPDDKKLKSIKLYRFSTGYNKMLFEKELFFDFDGKIVKTAYSSSENPDSSFTYIFYNDQKKIYLEVFIGSNKYDTIYTLRNFDEQSHIIEEIKYNIKRKELNELTTWKFKLMSDSLLRLEETIYQNNMTLNNILPYYKKDINFIVVNPSEVKVHTVRTVCQDTSYNSIYEDLFKLENNTLVSTKYPVEYEYNKQGDWSSMKGEGYFVKREMSFYQEGESEITKGFDYSKLVLDTLDLMMQTIPTKAWKNHRAKHAKIAAKTKLFNEGKYGKSIEKEVANAIEEFTPALWHLVSVDSGSIAGFENKCFVVGYNTPLKDKNEFNRRCLAIYERINGSYKLRKQSINAIESFVDQDDDFSFHDFNEANFTVGINEGKVFVSYSYMRGEASYSYAYQNDDWVLISYESNHRTCCEAEMYSYDYKTKMYSASITSTSGDETGDTSITIQQNRPVMYMDSMNVMQYDYSETGLLVK